MGYLYFFMQTIVQIVLLYVLIGCDDDIHIAVDVVRHIMSGPILRNFSGCTISKVHV